MLDFPTVFRAAYEPALYQRRLPYDQPLIPPLAHADQTWVEERIKP
jgi:hypothetical protein